MRCLRFRVLAPALWVSLLAGASAANAGGSPPRSVNLSPAHLVFLQPNAEGARVVPPGTHRISLDVAYATVIVEDRSGPARALLDMEIARASLRCLVGAGSGTELSLEVPVLWSGGGALDGLLLDYHGALGVEDERRDHPRNTYTYRVTDGARVHSPSAGAGLGDVTLGGKIRWADAGEGSPAVATRALFKFPTGTEGNGFGSGGADVAAGLLAEGRAGPVEIFGTLDGVYLGRSPDDALPLRTHWSFHATIAAAVGLGGLGDLGVGLRYAASPYDTGLDAFDRDPVILAAGFRRRAAGLRWTVGFAEDLNVTAAPDFTVFVSGEWGAARFAGEELPESAAAFVAGDGEPRSAAARRIHRSADTVENR